MNEAYNKVKSMPVDEIEVKSILNEILINKEKYNVSINDIIGFMLGLIFAGIETV